ncbi:MAG: WhiB family transcriptional regulator [Acidimicrobiales bacterium]|nr:WhiB family transcriptional regulator [Acidimicrobiales bacterium]
MLDVDWSSGVDPAEVLAVTLDLRPPWHRDALCREPNYARVDWHPRSETEARCEAAMDVCSRCLVRDDCLADALSTPWLVGVRAGTTTAERSRMRAERRADEAADRGEWTAASVIALRAEGLTWRAVGALLGITGSRAHQLGTRSPTLPREAPGSVNDREPMTGIASPHASAQAPHAAA